MSCFRILLHQRHHFDARIAVRFRLELFQEAFDVGDSLRLVVLDCNRGLPYSERALDDGCSDDDLLTLFQKCPEVGGEVWLTLATVDYQHLAFLAGRRREFHVRRESGTSQTDDSAKLDLFDYRFRILRDGGDDSLGAIDCLKPLVTLDGDFDIGLEIAGKILPRSYGLDSTGD